MAEKFGAIIKNGAFLFSFPLFKDDSTTSISAPNYINFRFKFHFSRTLTMAPICSSEVHETSPPSKVPKLSHENGESEKLSKVPKLSHENGESEKLSKVPKFSHENGESEKSSNPSTLLRVKKLSEKAVLPSRASVLSAGYDLSSAAETKVPARGKVLVPTDLSIAIPEGTYARIAPRSGLALKHAIDVGAGVIDADYRGPVGVLLFNNSDEDFVVRVGDRIAQMILEKIVTPKVLEVEDLDSTARGEGGFGSTGV